MNTMRFLYPTSRKFAFDEVCEQIVRALEARNWSVPGVTVELETYGSGEEKYRYVSRIKGPDFKLWFCRRQASTSSSNVRYNDIAGVSEIGIPKQQISVYDDESGPTFYLYVGDDWERDRANFSDGSKVNSKLLRAPRTYLRYTGGCDCEDGMRHTHPKYRSPSLLHTNDLGREYDPEGEEPKRFHTAEVLQEFRDYLNGVLTLLSSYPVAEKIEVAVEEIPFPTSVGPLFCFGERRDAARIRQGKRDPSQLTPAERYGMPFAGYRLVSLGTRSGEVPEIAYEGFLWCGFGEGSFANAGHLKVPGHTRWERESEVIQLKLASANHVYVVDHAVYDKRRKEIADATTDGRDYFSNSEIADFVCARARTIVPIHLYKGDYEQPVVLIARELSFDEVDVVTDRVDLS